MTSRKPAFRTLSSSALAVVQGGGRHAERQAAETSVSVSYCDVVTIPLPLGMGSIEASRCEDGSGSVRYVPPAGGPA